jgi:secondary thiamine-phosphate synthase enzyme
MVELNVRTSKQTEFVPITDRVQDAVDESGVKDGVCYVYVPHTTAGVTINENADPMAPHDVLLAVDKLIPMRDPEYRHMEGNSAAHVKACFFGSSEAIPIDNGRLVLGTWQGIFFCEFDGPRSRKALVKVIEG